MAVREASSSAAIFPALWNTSMCTVPLNGTSGPGARTSTLVMYGTSGRATSPMGTISACDRLGGRSLSGLPGP